MSTNNLSQILMINDNIQYETETLMFNKPLTMKNTSKLSTLVFKIKTNNSKLLSIAISHDFISPGQSLEIPIKLFELPSEDIIIQLEINYAIATEEIIQNKDSKMKTINKADIKKLRIKLSKNKTKRNIKNIRQYESHLQTQENMFQSILQNKNQTQQTKQELSISNQKTSLFSLSATQTQNVIIEQQQQQDYDQVQYEIDQTKKKISQCKKQIQQIQISQKQLSQMTGCENKYISIKKVIIYILGAYAVGSYLNWILY